ncbi:MAG: nitrous oxide-stimulated promoter family protein [Bacteroidetes bacterium]|nr:nitrous oxide-stimulated promoter family protein [Bacteroidota bacterium]
MQSNKIQIEKATVKAMIEIYCKSNHKTGKICDECNELIDYALLRTEKCKYKENKPACKNCITHCYSPAKREKIKEVMRFSGPRMIYIHPILSIRHLISKLKK